MIDPWKVHFSQDWVSWNFGSGQAIGDTANDLRTGVISHLPPIRIFERDGILYSLDNRRLLTYRSAGLDIPYIRVRNTFGDARERFENPFGGNPWIQFP